MRSEIDWTKFRGEPCGNVKVMEDFGDDVEADIVIWTTAEKNWNQSFVAWATSCQLDEQTNRPIMG